MHRSTAVQSRVTVKRYDQGGFETTRQYLRDTLDVPSVSSGASMLLQCRTGALWTAVHAARAGMLDAHWGDTCPCCQQQGLSETVEHIILQCSAWQAEREIMLSSLRRLEGAESAWSGWSPAERLNWLLGGTAHEVPSNGVGIHADGSGESGDDGDNNNLPLLSDEADNERAEDEPQEPRWVPVARFLGTIRATRVARLRSPPTLSQRPNG